MLHGDSSKDFIKRYSGSNSEPKRITKQREYACVRRKFGSKSQGKEVNVKPRWKLDLNIM